MTIEEIKENEIEDQIIDDEPEVDVDDNLENQEEIDDPELDENGDPIEAEPEIEMSAWTDDDGVEWELPASIIPSLMKNKDYTTKTSQVSEQRKALEAEREAFMVQKKRDAEDFKLESELFNVDQRLKAYENVDWQTLRANDPDAANGHFQDMTMLQQQRQTLAQDKEQRSNEKAQESQQLFAKRIEETESFAIQNIPNWDKGEAPKILAFANENGLTENFLRSNLNPAVLKMIYGAYTSEKIKQKAATPQARQKSNITPLKQVKAKSGTTTRVNLQTADMDSYAKARARGVGG